MSFTCFFSFLLFVTLPPQFRLVLLLVWTIDVAPTQPWLLPWTMGFTLHTAGWFAFQRHAFGRPLPYSEIFTASLFPRKWSSKTYSSSYVQRCMCHDFPTHGVCFGQVVPFCLLTCPDFSVLLTFLLCLEWHLKSLYLPNPFLTWLIETRTFWDHV